MLFLVAAWACLWAAPAGAASDRPRYGAFGFDVSGMDRAVAPGDDFFGYANGTWVRITPIPADRSSYNTFAMLRETASRRTAAIIAEAAKSRAPEGSDARKIGDYFTSFMDEATIEARGSAPLRPILARIGAISDRRDLARELGGGLRADVDALNATDLTTDRLFGLWVAEDMNDTSRYRPYLMQGGLTLPDRDYYLSDAPRSRELRAALAAHAARMFVLAGFDQAEARADRVMALETAIARAHWTASQTTDVTRTNTVWALDAFAREAPGLDWAIFFEAAGLSGQPAAGAWQSGAIQGIAALVGAEPLQAWKDYLAFHAIERGAPFLSKAFVDEEFAFQGRTLTGAPEQPARWKRAVGHTNEALGEAIGRIYVRRWFHPADQAMAEAMVANILAAFGARIDSLDWMSPQTKARARQKLARFQVGIGRPKRWRDYSSLRVLRGDAFGNRERAELFEYRRNLAKLGGPVDRGEWFLLPQDVNALNAPLQNSIVFPAALLQPPFFDPAADPAVNYGAIGGIIGHEISHGFDNTGALFDERGVLHDWWTPQDKAHFDAAGRALAAQYDAYRPFPDAQVNGELTLGENIADLAGLAAAYEAYRLSLGGRPGPVIDSFTGDQRFFLGWAQNYRSIQREGSLRRSLLTDVHAPARYRADTVRNLDAWYDAFDVNPGQALYLAPAQRVRMW